MTLAAKTEDRDCEHRGIRRTGPDRLPRLDWPRSHLSRRRGRAADHRPGRPRDHPHLRHRVHPPSTRTEPSCDRSRGGSTARARASPSSRARRLVSFGEDDFEEAAAALQPGTSAAILVWGNRWAVPSHRAASLRRAARRQRPDPDRGHPGRARRGRGHPLKPEGEERAGIDPRARPHRRDSRHRHRRQQPRLAPPGGALVRTGDRPTNTQRPSRSTTRRRRLRAAADPVARAQEVAEPARRGHPTEEEFSAEKAKILNG